MKKIDLGQMITILANLGVIFGVAFLVLELRQTNAIARVNSYQQTMSEIAAWRTTIVTDAESMRLFEIYLSDIAPTDISETERLKLTMLMSNLFGAHENAYFSFRYGILSDSEWERIERAACNQFQILERKRLIEIPFISQAYLAHLRSAC